MKSLLRGRSSNTNVDAKSSRDSSATPNRSMEAVPPLYARFTSSASAERLPQSGSKGVSGPMALAPKASNAYPQARASAEQYRDLGSRSASHGALLQQAQQSPSSSSPPYARASGEQPRDLGSRSVSHGALQGQAPQTANVNPPVRKSSRMHGHAPKLSIDKPLPVPVPDPTSSPPKPIVSFAPSSTRIPEEPSPQSPRSPRMMPSASAPARTPTTPTRDRTHSPSNAQYQSHSPQHSDPTRPSYKRTSSSAPAPFTLTLPQFQIRTAPQPQHPSQHQHQHQHQHQSYVQPQAQPPQSSSKFTITEPASSNPHGRNAASYGLDDLPPASHLPRSNSNANSRSAHSAPQAIQLQSKSLSPTKQKQLQAQAQMYEWNPAQSPPPPASMSYPHQQPHQQQQPRSDERYASTPTSASVHSPITALSPASIPSPASPPNPAFTPISPAPPPKPNRNESSNNRLGPSSPPTHGYRNLPPTQSPSMNVGSPSSPASASRSPPMPPPASLPPPASAPRSLPVPPPSQQQPPPTDVAPARHHPLPQPPAPSHSRSPPPPTDDSRLSSAPSKTKLRKPDATSAPPPSIVDEWEREAALYVSRASMVIGQSPVVHTHELAPMAESRMSVGDPRQRAYDRMAVTGHAPPPAAPRPPDKSARERDTERERARPEKPKRGDSSNKLRKRESVAVPKDGGAPSSSDNDARRDPHHAHHDPRQPHRLHRTHTNSLTQQRTSAYAAPESEAPAPAPAAPSPPPKAKKLHRKSTRDVDTREPTLPVMTPPDVSERHSLVPSYPPASTECHSLVPSYPPASMPSPPLQGYGQAQIRSPTTTSPPMRPVQTQMVDDRGRRRASPPPAQTPYLWADPQAHRQAQQQQQQQPAYHRQDPYHHPQSNQPNAMPVRGRPRIFATVDEEPPAAPQPERSVEKEGGGGDDSFETNDSFATALSSTTKPSLRDDTTTYGGRGGATVNSSPMLRMSVVFGERAGEEGGQRQRQRNGEMPRFDRQETVTPLNAGALGREDVPSWYGERAPAPASDTTATHLYPSRYRYPDEERNVPEAAFSSGDVSLAAQDGSGYSSQRRSTAFTDSGPDQKQVDVEGAVERAKAMVGENDDAAATAAAAAAYEREEEAEVRSSVPEDIIVRDPGVYPLLVHVSSPPLLAALLAHLSFESFQAVLATCRDVRDTLSERRELREEVLERYLNGVGYVRWGGRADDEGGESGWEGEQEDMVLTLDDLNAYMRGVSVPNYLYVSLAENCLQAPRESAVVHRLMRKSARAYTRVVLRLRAQVEAAARVRAKHGFVQSPVGEPGAGPPTAWAPNQGAPTAQARRQFSRSSSRAPSPTDTEDYAVSRTGHSRSRSRVSNRAPQSVAEKRTTGGAFRSPLFKPGRAALLRVFVPSREGSWLSDESVVRCEEELRKAAAGMRGMGLLKVGDVVWDVAVGEEGNVGRLVWDGAYLIDLDYTYSRTGDVPKYLHSLAFPPSYFHRVIRSAPAPTPAPPPSSSPGTHTDNSAGTANPIVHVDLRPWADEICGSVRLMQDRLRTEGRRTVVRWVHRARFHIRGGGEGGIPIPGTDAVVDRGWYGAVVVEAEGTNEGLAELRARCGVERHPRYGEAEWEERKVFRILRERSRPGEIWIRTVGEKERLM